MQRLIVILILLVALGAAGWLAASPVPVVLAAGAGVLGAWPVLVPRGPATASGTASGWRWADCVTCVRLGMLLQADPTVIYALQDFGIRRLLFKHLTYDSPYNTYRYKGLPPGPINLPDATSIDAVLNPEQHDYLYFCASPEFNGYHIFARNAQEHAANARLYQQALNQRGIR